MDTLSVGLDLPGFGLQESMFMGPKYSDSRIAMLMNTLLEGMDFYILHSFLSQQLKFDHL